MVLQMAPGLYWQETRLKCVKLKNSWLCISGTWLSRFSCEIAMTFTRVSALTICEVKWSKIWKHVRLISEYLFCSLAKLLQSGRRRNYCILPSTFQHVKPKLSNYFSRKILCLLLWWTGEMNIYGCSSNWILAGNRSKRKTQRERDACVKCIS